MWNQTHVWNNNISVMARILTACFFSRSSMGLCAVLSVLIFVLLANLYHYVDKVSIASSNSLCDLGREMRLLWSEMIWSLSVLSECDGDRGRAQQFIAANSWQERRLLQWTQSFLCKHHIHYHSKMRDWPLESGNLLAACYSISFQRWCQCV